MSKYKKNRKKKYSGSRKSGYRAAKVYRGGIRL